MSRTKAAPAADDGQKASLPRTRSREKTREELHLAMLRVKNKGLKLSISAVAAEAGVSAGLIHNTYPDIAEEIRALVGRKFRQQRDGMAKELAEAKKRMRELRKDLDAALADLTKIASINETLRTELATLRAIATSNIHAIPQRTKT